MSATDYPPEAVDFLSQFFGPGNALRWNAFLNSETISEDLRNLMHPWIERFRNQEMPLLLPRIREDDQSAIEWYAIAGDARQMRALREQLLAFVGSTYTDFTGKPADLVDADPVDAAVGERYSPYVFRLRVIEPDDSEKVRNRLTLLKSLQEHQPQRSTQSHRPVGRILRDLEMALVVRNDPSAWQCLEELRSRGRFSAHNLAFLAVRIHAAFGEWQDILSRPETQSLFTVARPTQVTQALIKAVYEVHISKYERSGDVEGCVSRFRELAPSLGFLFHARGSLNHPVVLKAFMCRAVSAEPVQSETIHTILSEFPEEAPDRSWACALADFGRSLTPKTKTLAAPVPVIDVAREAYDADDFDRAFELLCDCEPNSEVIRRLLTCAREINSLEVIQRCDAYIESAPSDIRESALAMRTCRDIWARHKEQLCVDADAELREEVVIDSWIAWLKMLNDHGPWTRAIDIAQRGSTEWDQDTLKSDPPQVTRLRELLESGRSPDADVVLRNAVPEMIKFFLPENEVVREFKSIYLSLTYVLALDDAIGSDDLTAFTALAEAILVCAPEVSASRGTNEYEELLDTIDVAWNRVAAPRHIDWALTVLDLLIVFNVRQHAPVDRFFNRVIDGFREWSRRISQDQWDLLGHLAEDLGLTDMLSGLRPEDEDSKAGLPSLISQLSGKSIAIYTLTHRIGQRAREFINRRFEGVTVRLLHDRVSSDRLVQSARSADIFIVNTWDAKHAATDAIRQHRPSDYATLFPESRSPGSILRALYALADPP